MLLKGRMREGNMPLSCRHTRKLPVVRVLGPRTLNIGEVHDWTSEGSVSFMKGMDV